MTRDGFNYNPAEGHSEGSLRFTVELSEVPDLDIEPGRFATKQAQLSTIKMDDNWGTQTLSTAIQYVKDGGLV